MTKIPRPIAVLLLLVVGGCSDASRDAGPSDVPSSNAASSSVSACADCNVVLISIDTLRADHLGTYGYERPTSPNIDALADSSVVFDRCIAQSPETLGSHMSIFTSLYPNNHGVVNQNRSLPDETVTLADVLHDNGYRTAAFTGGGFVREKFNYHTFDLFEQSAYWDVHNEVNQQFDSMLAWLEQQEDRFFLFWHTYKVHSPYFPAEEYDRFSDPGYDGVVDPDPSRPTPVCDESEKRGCNWRGRDYYDRLLDSMESPDVQHVVDMYDGEILQVDELIGRFVERLGELNLLDNTVVVFTSDHGESFADRDQPRIIGHGVLYREVLEVPLLIRIPGQQPKRVEELVESIDIMPTILDILELEIPAGLDGETLFSPRPADDAVVVAYSQFPARKNDAVLFGNFHLIRSYRGKKETLELYDLASDPRETQNLLGQGHAIEQAALQILRDRSLLEDRGADDHELDGKTIEELRALGYL